MDDNNTILKDLGELVENTKSAVKAKFSYEDVTSMTHQRLWHI